MRSPGVRRVYREGRALPGERVVLFVAPGTGEVAAVASGKVGGAVQRNRARRIIRAALCEVAPSGVPDRDAVVVARSSIRGATSSEIAAELRALMERAGSSS